jgi:excisionase family DNA binding protein
VWRNPYDKMSAILLLDSTDDAQTGEDRGRLETVLREKGYTVVALDPGADGGSTLRSRVTALVEEANRAETERLTDAVSDSPADDLQERFWGPAPDATTVVRAVFDDLADQFAQRRAVAADGISRDEAAELLGVTPQSITARLASGKLVGIKIGREWRLPAWQFDPDDPSGVLPDLDVLQDVFPGGPVSLTRWMLAVRPEFDGRSAREAWAGGGGAAVIEFARSLTATGW